jgi:hypothetical protein
VVVIAAVVYPLFYVVAAALSRFGFLPRDWFSRQAKVWNSAEANASTWSIDEAMTQNGSSVSVVAMLSLGAAGAIASSAQEALSTFQFAGNDNAPPSQSVHTTIYRMAR